MTASGCDLGQPGEALPAARRWRHGVARALEVDAQQLPRRGIVLDDEDLRQARRQPGSSLGNACSRWPPDRQVDRELAADADLRLDLHAPPCASTSWRVSASPRPVPSWCARCSVGLALLERLEDALEVLLRRMPRPVSATVKRACARLVELEGEADLAARRR